MTNKAPDNFELKLYAIKSKDGKWFKSRGQSGSGPRWVDGIDAAKIYSKPGPAKAIITWWGKNFPKFGTPDLVEIVAKEFNVIDQKDRVKEVQQKEAEAEARYKIKLQQQKLDNAKKKLTEAQAELDRLQKVKENNAPLESHVLKRKMKYAKRSLEDAQDELEELNIKGSKL